MVEDGEAKEYVMGEAQQVVVPMEGVLIQAIPASSPSSSSILPSTTLNQEPKPSCPPSTHHRFCSCFCCADFMAALGLYVFFVTLATVIAVHVNPKEVGLVVLSLLPALFVLSLLQRRFSKSVLRLQMAFTFMEAVLWMCPIGTSKQGLLM